MDLKEDLDKKLKNKKLIDEWLKSYQNAINVLNSSYIDEDSIKIFLLSSNQIVHFNNFVNILYRDSKLPTSNNKYYKKIFKYSIGESIDGRSKISPIKEFPIGDWLECLYIITMWLSEKNESAPLDAKIEYIGCSAELNVDGGMNDLKDIVKNFLHDYGFENKDI